MIVGPCKPYDNYVDGRLSQLRTEYGVQYMHVISFGAVNSDALAQQLIMAKTKRLCTWTVMRWILHSIS